jgi:hypothetical protein
MTSDEPELIADLHSRTSHWPELGTFISTRKCDTLRDSCRQETCGGDAHLRALTGCAWRRWCLAPLARNESRQHSKSAPPCRISCSQATMRRLSHRDKNTARYQGRRCNLDEPRLAGRKLFTRDQRVKNQRRSDFGCVQAASFGARMIISYVCHSLGLRQRPIS